MTNPFENGNCAYKVVIDGQGHHLVQPSSAEVPEGWSEIGPRSNNKDLLEWIGANWTGTRSFFESRLKELKSLDIVGEQILWHYTTGDALIKIVQCRTLLATHISCLNDSSELRYSAKLLGDALADLYDRGSADSETIHLLDRLTADVLREPVAPRHAESPWFVASFSEKEDDLSQWRAYSGGENGFAIGFKAEGFGTPGAGPLYRVSYNLELHKRVMARVAQSTVQFFCDCLGNRKTGVAADWAREFLDF